MKLSRLFLGFLLLGSGLLAQDSGPATKSSTTGTDLTGEVESLREALSQTQKQLAAQQQEIEMLKARARVGPASDNATVTEMDERTYDLTSSAGSSGAAQTSTAASQQGAPRQESSQPLGSFKFGGAVLDLGGFVDLENIYRTTNTQSNIATAFASIPYSNTPQGNISEFRTTAQFSRLSVKLTDNFKGSHLLGYLETDFSGNDAPNVYQSVNGHTNRLRLYFVDLRHSKWELLAGQTWSWLTPNRTGLGPTPVDLALTYNEDQNLGVGVPYTRAAELRIAYHPNEHWAVGVGIEDANQFIGGYIALPAAFTSIGTQFDNGAQIGAANAFPDLLSKVAYDRDFSGRHFHAELTGLFTGSHASVMPIGTTAFRTHSTVGGGGQIAANYEVLPKLTLLANAFWSDGGAHYLVGTGPQLVARPDATGTDVSLSMVHAGAGSAVVEWRATPKDAFAVYYAADYFVRDFFPVRRTLHILGR